MNRNTKTHFDYTTAKEMVDSFAYTSGVHCRLFNDNGILLYEQGDIAGTCAFCRMREKITGKGEDCISIHRHGAMEADRFGGRYIYFCPSGLAYFSSPIVTGGSVTGMFVGGPVLIMDEEEIISDCTEGYEPEQSQLKALYESLKSIPKMAPARLSYLSAQLFSNTVYVSDSTHELFLSRKGNYQQNTISNYIQQLKTDNGGKLYPVETEQELTAAIGKGNFDASERYLNELLGYLIFSAADRDSLCSRMTELLAVMGRSALYSGASSEQVFTICQDGIQKLRELKRTEDMTKLMLDCRGLLTELVYNLSDTTHKNVMHRTVNYIEQNLSQKITLAQVAEYAGYSPSYFSRLFHEEIGSTFQNYLNSLRIERSKFYLLSTTLSGAEICGLVGFEDQSYFTKTFKRFTGVTPDQYRKRKRRIDSSLERDS